MNPERQKEAQAAAMGFFRTFDQKMNKNTAYVCDQIGRLAGHEAKLYAAGIAKQASLFNQLRCMLGVLGATAPEDDVFRTTLLALDAMDSEMSKVQAATTAMALTKLSPDRHVAMQAYNMLNELISRERELFGDTLVETMDMAVQARKGG